eukprot:TRINITY_DN1353_c0_g1_i6.p1 TRINITY_DN1353_c0_g1~~TRINITY_DN1353_c0_g1_i6.p1  ORF type:complete len:341 (-),score=27.37 TRINITY_DN1353_c0_g1_i6:2109-3131(-)
MFGRGHRFRLHTQKWRRFFCSAVKRKLPALGLDVDGLLVRGKVPFEEAKRSLKIIRKLDIPFVILTNGGGTSESSKAQQLSNLLNTEIHAEEVVLSHSPLRLFTQYRDRWILLSGQGDLKNIASSYGFQKVITVDELAQHYPLIDPFSTFDTLEHRWFLDEYKISAIFVMHDPKMWERNFQVLIDVLRSDGSIGSLSPHQQIPLYFTNPDFLWTAEYHLPRFAQGAFRLCLSTIFQELTGRKLEYTTLGKPNKITYDYASSLLQRNAQSKNISISRYYGLGDNPCSDIAGANRAGWTSILVKSGNIGDHGSDKSNKEFEPTFVCEHVEDAIELILKRENL